MLKDAAVVFAKPLTRIVNESLSQGTVPSEWKYAKITPLFKKGLSTDMDNYCPISVLPLVSKVLERIVHHQLHRNISCSTPTSVASEGTTQLNLPLLPF